VKPSIRIDLQKRGLGPLLPRLKQGVRALAGVHRAGRGRSLGLSLVATQQPRSFSKKKIGLSIPCRIYCILYISRTALSPFSIVVFMALTATVLYCTVLYDA
jgi:hypothetical protein